jgi:hypothetical protein
MTVKRFRFVSPGVKINEIDRSVLTTTVGDIGPSVVGLFQRGPGMIPVTVETGVQLDSLFGTPTRGVVNSTTTDVWRTGQLQSPTYGAYAAQAWLKNSSPLTVLRALGVQHPSATKTNINSLAGWVAGSGSAEGGGAWGLFIAPSASAGSAVTGALAAVFYLTEGSVELSGTTLDGTPFQGTNKLVKSSADNYEFRLVIKNAAAQEKVKTAINFEPTSTKYIRRTLNTNPVLTNSEITADSNTKTYWLGESFETFLKDNVSTTTAGDVVATLVPLQTGSGSELVNMGNHLGVQAQPAKSGWIISQDLNSLTSSFNAEEMPKLFRFVTLGGEQGDSSGEYEQKNIKISIEDIKASRNAFNKYGSFTVKVRKMDDTDSTQQTPLEVFTNVNLDPTSPNYIARIVGDKYVVWNETQKRHMSLGNFTNRSNYIRVEIHPLLEQGALDPELLPFGFFGPPTFKPALLQSGVEAENTLISGAVGDVSDDLELNLLFPQIPMVVTASNFIATKYHGLDVRKDSGNLFNPEFLDMLRAKPAGVDSYEADDELTINSQVFTLDEVSSSVLLTGQDPSERKGIWVPGSRVAGTSITAVSASGEGSSEGYRSVLNSGLNKFTFPIFGGTDGLRITEKNPFCNRFLDEAPDEDKEGTSNYALYSLKRALDSIADPEVLDTNIITVPGVTNTTITDRAIEICETRADALAIIDVPGGYRPESETDEPECDRVGSSQEVISNVIQRQFNSSYGCTYYPWVKISDLRENGDVWVPPSVVALGTMASSQEVSAVWFAPAGFNRGGLDRGSSGLRVIEVRETLRSTQRDDLYEVNINPIARFPSEGIVIFGQKTLQATPSALDRINVRRLVLFLKKQISRIASGLLFDQNIVTTWQRFLNQVRPLMDRVKSGGGLTDYRVVLDQTTTTPDLIDRNTMYAKVFIKPAYAIEFIAIDFVVTNTGASFDDL